MNNVFISGHTGFVGSHLSESLQRRNFRIIGVSRRKTKDSKIQQIRKDIRKITSADIGEELDGIIHLAAITDIQYCHDHPIECSEINVMGTEKILEIARKKDCKFVYVSTAHVYGIPKKIPVREDHPRNPTSIYAASKFGGEIICESYAKAYGMNISIVRPFSVYGPREAPFFVVPRIISQLKLNKSIKLGNLYPKRDFVYISDVINAIELIYKKTGGFNIYNVGTGESHSILEVCNLLMKIANSEMNVKSIVKQSRKMEVSNLVSDSTLIRKHGWTPKVTLNEGLLKCFNEFSNL